MQLIAGHLQKDASLLPSLTLTTNYPSKTWLRVIEILDESKYTRPVNRLRDLKRTIQILGEADKLPRGFYHELEMADLVPALLDHKGLEDVPVNTIHKNGDHVGFSMSLYDYVQAIEEGKTVVQYIVEFMPDWIKSRKNPSVKEKPEAGLDYEDVAKVKGSSNKTVIDKIANGELTGGQYAGRWYVIPDEKFESWVTSLKDPTTLHRRLIHLQDALDLYTGSSIDEVYQMANEIEANSNQYRKGRHAKKDIKTAFQAYFEIIPNTVEGLRRSLWEFIEKVEKDKYDIYRKRI